MITERHSKNMHESSGKIPATMGKGMKLEAFDGKALHTQGRLLVFLDRNREKSWDFYRPVLRKENLSCQYQTISEYPGCDFYYQMNCDWSQRTSSEQFWELYRSLDLHDMTTRCRVLRALDGNRARGLVKKALGYCLHLFSNHQFDRLVIFTVDRYSIDVMVRVAHWYGVSVIPVGGSFIRGTKRLTFYGEPQKIRTVPDEEIDRMFEQMQSQHNSAGKPGVRKAVLSALRDDASVWLRIIIHYYFRHKVLRQWHYDYLLAAQQPRTAVLNIVRHRKSRFHIRTVAGLRALKGKPCVYIPLHYTPEATVDYWTDEPEKAYYTDSLCEVISTLRGWGVSVALKEHPAMYLRRPPDFYRMLSQHENVSLIWPFLETTHVLEFFEKVIVWTGTTGIEAAILGKDVYLYTKNFWDNGLFRSWKEVDKPSGVGRDQGRQILKQFLENLVCE